MFLNKIADICGGRGHRGDVIEYTGGTNETGTGAVGTGDFDVAQGERESGSQADV